MSGYEKITKREQLYLSLSPFTIPELFQTNLHTMFSPYLIAGRKKTVPKGFVFYQTEELAGECFYLKQGVVIEALMNENGLMKAVLKTVALDFRLANSSVLQTQSCSVHEKICQTIVSYFIAGRYNREVKTMRMTQQLLADLTGVHRVSVAQTVRKLRDEGILGSKGKKLVLLDEERLRILAYGKYSIH